MASMVAVRMNVETPDLYLSAYVIATGTPLASTRRDGRRVIFGFDVQSVEQWEQLQRDFHSGNGVVSGKKMAEATKAVKALVAVT